MIDPKLIAISPNFEFVLILKDIKRKLSRENSDIFAHNQTFELCLVHVIWTGHRMLKLVLNVKYLLLLSFLTAAEFYNLGHIQGIIRVH